jgi:hypothetical protein
MWVQYVVFMCSHAENENENENEKYMCALCELPVGKLRPVGLRTGKESRGQLHRQHSNRIKKSECLLGKPHIWIYFIIVYR